MLQSCLNPRDSHAQPSCGSTRNHQLRRSCYESWMWDFISWLCEYHKLIKLIVCVTLCLFALKIPRVSLSSTACPLLSYGPMRQFGLVRHCAKMGNTFCLSLSAPYVCRYFGDRILTVPWWKLVWDDPNAWWAKNPQSVKFMICVLGTCVLGIHGRQLSQRLSVRVRQKFCCQAIEKCWLRSCNC